MFLHRVQLNVEAEMLNTWWQGRQPESLSYCSPSSIWKSEGTSWQEEVQLPSRVIRLLPSQQIHPYLENPQLKSTRNQTKQKSTEIFA